MSSCLDAQYIIVPNGLVTAGIVEEAVEDSIDTLRHTTSGADKVILKFPKGKDIPPPIGMMPVMTYEEWCVERQKPEWEDN